MSVVRTVFYLTTVFAVGSVHAINAPVPTPVIETTYGQVQGIITAGIAAYKGIRYGAPPVGEHRFLPPQPPVPWEGVADAIGYGAPAMQMYAQSGPTTDLSRQIATVFTIGSDQKIDNEDCLFLNVWTPMTKTSKRPVMVWFHGGGYAYGSGHWPVYDGANLAAKGDVIVVTVNHRLNVFGYLHLAEIAGEKYAQSGNAGMLDLILALRWVRDNITAFGGDPGNVTIMGESGGGSKVSTLMAMPAADGLFHKAVIQSGPGLTGVSVKSATNTARQILNELGLKPTQVNMLMTLTADRIMEATMSAAANAGPEFGAFRLAPVVDGRTLPRDPFTPSAPDQAKDIPVLIGWNKDEFTLFNTAAPWFGSLSQDDLLVRAKAMVGEQAGEILETYASLYPDYSPTYLLNMLIGDMRMFSGSVTLADRKVAQGGAPVYMYYLVWETPVGNGVFKSPHTLDMPFMFNNIDLSVALTGDSEEAHKLANQMSSSWIAFARSGNPNNTQVPEWPPYESSRRATMQFDADSMVVDDPKKSIRQLLTR